MLLSDFRLDGRNFRAGDRILATTCTELTEDQYRRLEKSIVKFVKTNVRFLVVNSQSVEIVLNRLDGSSKSLVAPSYSDDWLVAGLGVVNIDCSIINLGVGDSLVLFVKDTHPGFGKTILNLVKKWAGSDVEVEFVRV